MNEFIFSNVKNQEKWCKSRLVTTSASKKFIPKVGYFYPKSGVLLGASTYVLSGVRGTRCENTWRKNEEFCKVHVAKQNGFRINNTFIPK